MRRAFSLVLASSFALWLGACVSEQANLRDRADRTHKAMPGCDAGDMGACREACDAGGPNKACSRACDQNHGPSCLQLANRYEKQMDFDDAEAPSKRIEPADPEVVTGLYEKACSMGAPDGCPLAGARILNGIGRGKRDGGRAVELLKLGCQKGKSADSCCSMSQLNLKLAEGNNVNTITDFRSEARKWAALSHSYGKECPETIPEPPPPTDPDLPAPPPPKGK